MCVIDKDPEHTTCDLDPAFASSWSIEETKQWIRDLSITWRKFSPGQRTPSNTLHDSDCANPVWVANPLWPTERPEAWVCEECYYQYRLLALLKAGHLD